MAELPYSSNHFPLATFLLVPLPHPLRAVITDDADPLLLHLVRTSRGASSRTSAPRGDCKTTTQKTCPFLVLLQRILSYLNTRRHIAYFSPSELFLKTGVLLFQETSYILALSALVSHIQKEPAQQLCCNI